MTQAPSIKEALELLPCPFCNGEAESDSQRHYRNISTGNLEKSAAIYCTKCSADMTWCYRDTPEIEREQVMVILTEQWNTRATLQPSGERREAIARIIDPTAFDPISLASDHPSWAFRRERANERAGRILASGLVQEKSPGALDAPHNTGERELVVMPTYAPGGTESRVKARLAWNNWPDTEDSRRTIADHEAKDKNSADAWDRVISSLASGLVQDEAGIRRDEREKCAKIADREAEFWQDAESSSARIVAANIRSARDGGEG